jgi:predicted phage terminase large subunit-like protein
MEWSVVYKKAINPDGSLLFPERLSREFLDQARRNMGSYLFANQYQNEIIPDDEKRFKAHWLKYYKSIPNGTHTFVFVDPAIGQDKHHDYTGIVVIEVDFDGAWYLKVANRYRITPTEIIDKLFEIYTQFKPHAIGVEVVAYQEALLYFLDQEMKKRKVNLPIKGITRKAISKETRILGLVPRFEWGRIFLNQGLVDFEDEYAKFPRAQHDDLLDALASLEEIVFYPNKKEPKIEKPNSAADPNYERWYISELHNRAQQEEEDRI